MENNALERVIRPDQARVNVTYKGANGELPDPMSFDATDGDIKTMLTEVIRSGSIPGLQMDPDVDLRDFVVDRFPPTEARPYNLLMVRPKTPFGIAGVHTTSASPLRVSKYDTTQITNTNMGGRCPTCGR